MEKYTIPRKKQWRICININNLKRKANIIDHSIPYRAFGCAKHKNDRWRLIERAIKTRRLYRIRYREENMSFTMYEHALSKETVLQRFKWLGVIDVTEVDSK